MRSLRDRVRFNPAGCLGAEDRFLDRVTRCLVLVPEDLVFGLIINSSHDLGRVLNSTGLRTVRTGHGACLTTRSAVLPISPDW